MTKVGIVGLGDMGSGLAKNLIKAGFETYGFDLRQDRLDALAAMGGVPVTGPAEMGGEVDVAFVMVLNGTQAKEVILGGQGLASRLRPGSTVIISATIKPTEACDIGAGLAVQGLRVIDSPVSGGFPGAQSGTLTLMAAAPADVMEEHRPVLEAVGKNIFHVGNEPGQGQTVKACLQGLIGSIFTATFEAAVLGAKSGVSAQVLYDVFSASGAGNNITRNAMEKIMDRAFVGTGSHLGTMYKDLTITMDHAREFGVPMFTAGAAMQLFQAGITKFPAEDNWAVTKILEDIVGVSVQR
jgi:3-hydroxyisobutyrate dehydrogenase/putative dehydrogenase